MTNPIDEYRARLRESLGIINDLKAKIAAVEKAKTEPIAIVGMACRFSGGCTSIDAFWEGLVRGVDGVIEIPDERWPASENRAVGSEAQWAALLDGIDLFDPLFFGISPREATSLDPQHRLLLELTQEAIDDAGIRAESLFESRTGVYVGICTNDYWQGIVRHGSEAIDTYGATGNLFSTAAGRISYWLGAQGPCASIDTACSSSLVAMNFAYQGLHNGSCDIAIVGGVNAILSPSSMTMMSRLGALSPDGRCKTFDARANGYVRGEGCGVVVVKRLSDARRDGDRIYALILGSAVNQDGRSTGLTTPNVLSQQSLLQQALENARAAPEDIGLVETHGTGTPLGDPIEIDALKAVLGRRRQSGAPCVLGAVKTNIGHTEGAAGIAGLIKAALCLDREAVPKNLHQRALNPRIDLDGTPFLIPRELTPWPRVEKPRRAGVSSFGISGTNAHVILEESPREPAKTPQSTASAYLLPLSAKSPEALNALAQTYAEWFSQTNTSALEDIVYTAAARRTHHEHRLAAVAKTREEFIALLESFARGETASGITQGRAVPKQNPPIVFVFSGQGSQWAGMGKMLLAEESAFRTKVEEINALVKKYSTISLLDELQANEETSRLGETEIAQPALFAIQVGLTEWFKTWGIVPSAVVGHSVGEIAAAHVSGAISLEDAVRLVILRGRIMQKATGQGKMVWVGLPPNEAARAIAGLENDVAVGAINDPTSVVLSGNTSAIDALVSKLQASGVGIRPLRVNYAFHSPQMDPLANELISSLARLETKPEAIPIYSTVTGQRIDGRELDARYWGRNVRATVNLASAAQAALADGYCTMLEVGPHPVLFANLQQCAESKNTDARVISTLRRQADALRCMLETLGALHVGGAIVDWKQRYGHHGRVVSLPSYAWQRGRHWFHSSKARSRATRTGGGHPLLGVKFVPAAQPQLHIWEQWLSVDEFPYLGDHRVQGEIVFPGTGYVEMALAAAQAVLGEGFVQIEQIAFEQILSLTQDEERCVQVSLTETTGGRANVIISSQRKDAKEWTQHASGRVRVGPKSQISPRVRSQREIEKQCPTHIEHREHYTQTEARGLSYGPMFQGVSEIHVGAKEVIARVQVPDELRQGIAGYFAHPALLDACFQTTLWALPSTLGDGTFVPVAVGSLNIYEPLPSDVWVHAQVVSDTDTASPTITMSVHDDSGRALLEIGTLRLQALATEKSNTTEPFANCIFEIAWRPSDLASAPASNAQTARQWLVLVDASGMGSEVAEQLRARGHRVVEIAADDAYAQLGNDAYRLNPTDVTQWDKLLTKAFGKLGCFGIVDCLALDGATFQNTTESTLTTDMRRGSFSVLRIVQGVLKQGWRDVPRLYVLTRAAQAVAAHSGRLSVSQSMLWGLGRVLAIEHPDMGCVRIDLSPDRDPTESAMVVRELIAATDEDQIAYRLGQRYVARLVRGQWSPTDQTNERSEPAAGRPHRLSIHEPGVLERLVLRPMARKTPGAGEVEIEVKATGLNFLDVMKVMGIYPGMDPSSIQLGGECAGVVVAIGEGVTNVSVGQSVMASTPSSFATHVTTRAEFVVSKPDHISFEEAATIPAVFMTVYWALHHIGRLQQGERILIHSATGGTGLAAIQYAQAIGAEVFATAGSDEKRAFLRSMGIAHVMDSRSLAFADEVMAKTAGRGVDVVLNSLTGEALVRSLEVVAPYGRFLEIGKKDIYENTRLGMLPFRKAISYTAIDLAGMAQERPRMFGALLEEVSAKFADGTFKPEPVTVFSKNEAQDAFRLMAQAKHIGKIAVRMSDPDACIHVPNVSSAAIRADATYLITGGLGGLGLSLAHWMVQQGAKHLVLMGRNAPNAAAERAIADMRATGTVVHSMQANVARRAEVDTVIARILRDMPPLRGIVHAAAVLADRTSAEMEEGEFFLATEPKVFGAWNLHQATRNAPLDFFIMYSSSAGLLGSPGQANYAAANTFLDALAHARVAEGIPATSIQWGAFADVGLAAASDIRGNRIASRGSANFKPAEGNELFGRMLAAARPEVALMHFDARQWVEFYPQMAGAPFFHEIMQESGPADAPQKGSFRNELAQTAEPRRLALMETHLLEQLSKVLRFDSAKIDKRAPFTNLGIDSLMSLELRNRLEASLGLKLSATVLFTYATTQALANHLVERLFPRQAPIEEPTTSTHTPAAKDFSLEGEGDVETEAEEDEAALVDKLGEFEEFLK